MDPAVAALDSAAKVVVIIPYFQREPGLLRAAVSSVLRQRDAPCVRMIVIDDGSPVPAEHDLGAFAPDVRDRILVLHQPNRGVGAARNAGLERVPESAEWIAFLDPDDVWGESHLATAAAALGRGYDLFFADSRRGDSKTLFEASGLSPADHRLIDAARGLYEFSADLFTTVLTFSPVLTSTVVYRRDGHADLRFLEKYRTYEDSLFWLRFQGARIAFCTNIQASIGEGVNISKRPDDWRTNRAIEILRDIDGMYRVIPREFTLTPEQESLVRRLQRRNRRAVASTVLAMTRKRAKIDYAVVREIMGGTPALLGHCLRIGAVELAARTIGRRAAFGVGSVPRGRADRV